MGFWSKILYGVDLDAEQAASDAADARLRQLNAGSVDRGVWTAEQGAAADARIAGQAPVSDQVGEAFDEGWQEGAANVASVAERAISGVTGTAADIIRAPLMGIFKGIPWWLWIGGGIALAAYFGLLPGLLAAGRRAFKR